MHRAHALLRHLSTVPAASRSPMSRALCSSASAAGGESTKLARNTNQALALGQFALDFVDGRIGKPDPVVEKRAELFHTDSVFCGLSALALGTNAPCLLRREALEWYQMAPTAVPGHRTAYVFGSQTPVHAEKAIVANCSAVREWDSNGTVFGFNKRLGHTAGEFGHNDFYPVVLAACQQQHLDGKSFVRGMILLDEIRGRLAEVFSLKTYKIDHVVHGAIASAAVYGALLGATAEQIESAIGMCVAHYIPWRAIRAGKQLSDSKGASAALSTEVAIMSVHRAMAGFVGPKDIFRNPESIFRYFEPTKGDSPFDIVLTHSGSDFAIMGMHFKMGLYEHQSAGALQGLINLLNKHPELLKSPEAIQSIKITAYEPAFGIIGDPAKRDPRTRQSADHSMVYIVSTMLRKAFEQGSACLSQQSAGGESSHDHTWRSLMLSPLDYTPDAVFQEDTRRLMEKIQFEHGGPEYDRNYPDGIPTSITITDSSGREFSSGLVMYPAGHARNTSADLEAILRHKFELLGSLSVSDQRASVDRLSSLTTQSPQQLQQLYNFNIKWAPQEEQVF